MRPYLVAEGVGSPTVRPYTHGSEQTARGARSAWDATRTALTAFGTAIVRGFDRLIEGIERAQYAQRDAFFAQSIDLCDLEHRIQHYERTGLTRY